MKTFWFLLLLMPAQAVLAFTQADSLCMLNLNCRLERQAGQVSEVLTDPNYAHLHSSQTFRETIRRYARAEPIVIAGEEEPGERIVIKGRLSNKYKQPLSDALVYIYQADDRGWFAENAAHCGKPENDRREARLFGYCRTDEHGYFEIHTIRPRCSSGALKPSCLHLEFTSRDGQEIRTELFFQDDPLLNTEMRRSIVRNGQLVTINEGPEYEVELGVGKRGVVERGGD